MDPPAGARLVELERAWAGRLSGRLGRPLYVYEKLPSSLDALAALAGAGAPEGTCVLAESQGAGRGRRGRSWASQPGASLLLALLLRPRLAPERGGLVSLAAALALVRAARPFGIRLKVKWPNDVLHDGRKLAGILPEARLAGSAYRFLALGVGINVHQTPGDFPPALRGQASSLDLAAGRRLGRGELLAAYLSELEILLSALEAGELAKLLDDWRAAWPHRGRQARDEAGRELVLEDVDEWGGLVVTGPEGVETLVAGDLDLACDAARGPELDLRAGDASIDGDEGV